MLNSGPSRMCRTTKGAVAHWSPSLNEVARRPGVVRRSGASELPRLIGVSALPFAGGAGFQCAGTSGKSSASIEFAHVVSQGRTKGTSTHIEAGSADGL